ncbi:MAG: tryptophan--tRNA ligase [Candidatus Sungiibacteriota bacterium]|uniref:Tryptophan--tRNA ligase n=1 Tax=Candidatus Sungiibacteriota bacterium TaxID=2750080 RepID=A0A7T5RKF7_9BACT|nr:MAG: tryptophan--tRNA ligase [Candidatus Sungbacteria bacterium]
MKTLLSGIQPSGNLHIGNYLGAIKHWVELQKKYREFIAIVDLHAITVPQNPKILYQKTLEIAALLLACGINPKKSILFVQSHVPAHTELAWILNTLTPVGELERMTQFKEKQERSGALAGLLNYPILQAADILLYRPDVVPVGEDQLQHIEFTRTLARKFNNRFGKTFKEPKALLQKDAARVMGLDNPAKKMSKSAPSPNNYIALFDSPAQIRRKIKIAVTDSGSEVRYDQKIKPAISNLMTIYSAFAGLSRAQIEKKYRGKGYAEFKNDLGELLVRRLAPIQKKYQTLIKNKKALLAILKQGAKEADKTASVTLRLVKERVGFVS